MKYTIVVDNQDSTNPSDEAKEYVIDIEELRYKDGVYDTLVIGYDECYVIRRLELSKYYILSVLDEEVKETIDDVAIELFEGDNYIYLLDMEGNKLYAKYIVKNDFTDLYVTVNAMNSAITQSAEEIQLSVSQTLEGYTTTQELNSAITQTAEEISLEVSTKVGEDEIISKINQSSEEITIQADKISLEGYTTINEGFAIDEEGNASIANGAVCINSDGIQMADGTSIIGGDGIYTNLQFHSSSNYNGFIGYYGSTYTGFYQAYLTIEADIPSNFVVKTAYITIKHQPIAWAYDSSTVEGYGRNIQIYTETMDGAWSLDYDSDWYEYQEMPGSQTELLGSTGKTFSSSETESVSSDDVSDYLEAGSVTTFYIGSTTEASSISSASDMIANTGRGQATLNIIGFLNVE